MLFVVLWISANCLDTVFVVVVVCFYLSCFPCCVPVTTTHSTVQCSCCATDNHVLTGEHDSASGFLGGSVFRISIIFFFVEKIMHYLFGALSPIIVLAS